jgi:23S rRNA (cytosine1962-C5)-methyltransferase
VAALRAVMPELSGILGRDQAGDGETLEEDEGRGGGHLLFGTAPEQLTILEKGVRFRVDPWRGQKTGFFLDQRENRALVRHLAAGARVLNCFCFSGGFSVNAALGGAAQVFSVDQDADAIALARENFRENGLDPEGHDFLAADVFRLLQSFRDEGRQFDLVVLDPPAFAKTQRAVEAALDGYASLNRQALALVAPGGLLATSSCSARVSPEAFLGALKEAAAKAGVDLTLVEERYQPADHPVALAFPEGRYLKFHVLRAQPW